MQSSVFLLELNAGYTAFSNVYEDDLSQSRDFRIGNVVDGFYILSQESTSTTPIFFKTTVTTTATTIVNQLQLSNFASNDVQWILAIPSTTRFLAVPENNDTTTTRNNMVLLETNPTISVVSTINIGHNSFSREFAEHIGGTTIVANGRDTVEFFDYTNISSNAIVDSITTLTSDAFGFCPMPGETFYFLGTNRIEKRNRSNNSILESQLLASTSPKIVYNIPMSTYIIVGYEGIANGELYDYSGTLSLEETITKNKMSTRIL